MKKEMKKKSQILLFQKLIFVFVLIRIVEFGNDKKSHSDILNIYLYKAFLKSQYWISFFLHLEYMLLMVANGFNKLILYFKLKNKSWYEYQKVNTYKSSRCHHIRSYFVGTCMIYKIPLYFPVLNLRFNFPHVKMTLGRFDCSFRFFSVINITTWVLKYVRILGFQIFGFESPGEIQKK